MEDLNGNENFVGVTIPQEVLAAQKAKRKRHRSVRQLPVYRDTSQLKEIIISFMAEGPRKYAKFFDSLICTVSEAKKCIAMATICRDTYSMQDNQDFARILIEDTLDDVRILKDKNVISDLQQKRVKKLATKITSQLIAWRDSVDSQGVGSIQNVEFKNSEL